MSDKADHLGRFLIGVDYGTPQGDQPVVALHGKDAKSDKWEVLPWPTPFPRDKAKALLYGSLYGALPKIEFGAPLSSAVLNSIIQRVNELSERSNSEEERVRRFLGDDAQYRREYLGQPPPPAEEYKPMDWSEWCRQYQDSFLAPTEAARELIRERLRKGLEEAANHIKERLALQTPKKEEPMSGAFDIAIANRFNEELIHAKKEAPLPSAVDKRPRAFIEAQKKAIVDRVIQQHKDEVVAERAAEIKEAVHRKPKHCKRCGHDRGCMCNPAPEPCPVQRCEHHHVEQVSFSVAKELMSDGIRANDLCVHYACRNCGRLIISLPIGALPR